ncbi:MAG: hypothetical protein ACLQLC_02225 [Candidatus Sulfotelmatobacter sp.]
MPPHSPPEILPHTGAETKSEKAALLPVVCLAAAITLYLGVLLFGTVRNYGHLHLVLLFLQYVLILPCVVVCLRPKNGVPPVAREFSVDLRPVIFCFAVLALSLSWFSARGLLNPDESGYGFQARIYRSGRIMAAPLIGVSSIPAETPAEISYTNHVLRPFGWFPKFPPGWPLVLSLGYVVSAPWLINPIFGVLQLLVIVALGSLCFSRETGAIAALMAALSSFYLINSIDLMSHAWCALLAATACLCLFRGLEKGSLWYYAGMFACLAATLQVRPYTGFVFTLVLTAAALGLNRKSGHRLARIFVIGSFFGTLAIAGVLIYNHLCSGNWFVSPYAMYPGADLPPELSLNPARIWEGIRIYGLHTAEETLIGAFPFVHLLAGYALWRESSRRKEVWILAALYLGLVLAYLAHPDGSGVFLGERFHFEAFFALVLLAARGVQLLAQRWSSPRWVLVWTMLLLAIMQVGHEAAAAQAIARRTEPYRRVREAIAASGVSGLVFLHDAPGFAGRYFNLNEADWRHAGRIFLLDAEPERRAQWACRYGSPAYTVVTYDAHTHQGDFLEGKADCEGTNPP